MFVFYDSLNKRNWIYIKKKKRIKKKEKKRKERKARKWRNIKHGLQRGTIELLCFPCWNWMHYCIKDEYQCFLFFWGLLSIYVFPMFHICLHTWSYFLRTLIQCVSKKSSIICRAVKWSRFNHPRVYIGVEIWMLRVCYFEVLCWNPW